MRYSISIFTEKFSRSIALPLLESIGDDAAKRDYVEMFYTTAEDALSFDEFGRRPDVMIDWLWQNFPGTHQELRKQVLLATNAIAMNSLLAGDRESEEDSDGVVGRQPRRHQRRWELLGGCRTHNGWLSDLDAELLWTACHRPWMKWATTDFKGMLIALDRDSAGRSDLERLGAFELAAEWFGAEMLSVDAGRNLLGWAMEAMPGLEIDDLSKRDPTLINWARRLGQ